MKLLSKAKLVCCLFSLSLPQPCLLFPLSLVFTCLLAYAKRTYPFALQMQVTAVSDIILMAIRSPISFFISWWANSYLGCGAALLSALENNLRSFVLRCKLAQLLFLLPVPLLLCVLRPPPHNYIFVSEPASQLSALTTFHFTKIFINFWMESLPVVSLSPPALFQILMLHSPIISVDTPPQLPVSAVGFQKKKRQLPLLIVSENCNKCKEH